VSDTTKEAIENQRRRPKKESYKEWFECKV